MTASRESPEISTEFSTVVENRLGRAVAADAREPVRGCEATGRSMARPRGTGAEDDTTRDSRPGFVDTFRPDVYH